jgi:hypothetical protein
MASPTRRDLLKALLSGVLGAAGAAVVVTSAVASESPREEPTPADSFPPNEIEERAKKLAAELGPPPDNPEEMSAWINGGFRNGAFRNGGWVNGGGFRNGGFVNGGGGGFRNSRFRNW